MVPLSLFIGYALHAYEKNMKITLRDQKTL